MLEIYYYGRSRVPFMVHYTHQTYIYKLGEAWIPKVPNMAPSELKTILKQCFSYEPEDRPTASYLLKQIKTFNIDIGELELEPITDLNFYGYPKKDSEFDSTPVHGFDLDETPGAVNDPGSSKLDHSTDEDDKDDKEDRMFLDRSLKRLHELTMFKDDEGKAKYHALTKNTTDLALFHTKTEIILQLEDNYYSTSYYDIRELNGACDPQDLFKMFIDIGYCGYQHDLLHNDSTLLSFSTKKDICLTFKGMAGGTAGGTAKASHSSPLKKKLKLTDKRMKVYPINPEGNKVMRALSPRPSRKIDNPATPGSRSTGRTAMSLKYEGLTMAINTLRNDDYDYVIKFKEDEADVAFIKLNFSKSNTDEKDGCLIKVLPENNKALASTVAAYYYWHKAKQRKRQPIYQRFVSSISSKFGYNGGTRSRLL